MNRAYHNSTNEHGATLAQHEQQARRQDDQVAAVFRQHDPFGLSPSQVHRALDTSAPLTSIRRAISNLTAAGVLQKTDEQVNGPYGRREHRWRLTREPHQGRLL